MLATILWFIIVGAVIGVLARLIVPGRNPIGLPLTILVGIAGAILGGMVATAVGAGTLLAFLFSLLIAAGGVMLLTGGTSRGGWKGRRRWGSRRHTF
ncbi:GlsB/YeaQ/YmgE family stress response membrane protein [Actinomadura barringtoniae]|uniref:GlsB/YeaQ/YmgE family stress response membrane protein n=1 Tax=Actinomadura barringtoniae TaxID=1427535 RepID=A0A939PMK3_9ACTN|nr:GlsB/YeaQ/YmgE family stress response membrane protein [Actinomadura barringtoniae]MBO2455117.1 GlsB/YeaQ/YmgE family stress response membrane protein [Actinomadura barringtoniae]